MIALDPRYRDYLISLGLIDPDGPHTAGLVPGDAWVTRSELSGEVVEYVHIATGRGVVIVLTMSEYQKAIDRVAVKKEG